MVALGASYWQRASFDAVVVLLGIFGLVGFMPRWQHLQAHHFATTAVLLIAVISFYLLFFQSLNHADDALNWQVLDPTAAFALPGTSTKRYRGYDISGIDLGVG